tara:strand:- start:502 stop:741 length:240 start_codon:yes stop_codon:yes gene_type:complete
MTLVLEWDNSEMAAKLKRYDAEKVKAKETLYKSKHGPKRYKEFMKKDAEAKKPIKNPKGVRALHKGKWGYMKNRKFKAD